MRRMIPLALSALLLPALSFAAAEDTTAVGALRTEAKALAPLMKAPLTRRFLDATAILPNITPRTVWFDSARTHYWNAAAAATLPDTMRARLVNRTLDESFYYNTRYGSPLAYSRALEILSEHGFKDVAAKRIADFGYGTIGHLRLLASLGADANGIDVDKLLEVYYSEPGDLGTITGPQGQLGRLTLHTGRWPAEPAIVSSVSGGYDLFLSKNTLKNGYIHPAEKVNPRMLVNLGVSDTVFVRELHRMLKPGGLALIYNLSPAPAPPGKPYIPWADGRCPFERALWEAAGFEVLAFDVDDSKAARAMGHALGWDAGSSPMDLEHDLFGTLDAGAAQEVGAHRYGSERTNSAMVAANHAGSLSGCRCPVCGDSARRACGMSASSRSPARRANAVSRAPHRMSVGVASAASSRVASCSSASPICARAALRSRWRTPRRTSSATGPTQRQSNTQRSYAAQRCA